MTPKATQARNPGKNEFGQSDIFHTALGCAVLLSATLPTHVAWWEPPAPWVSARASCRLRNTVGLASNNITSTSTLYGVCDVYLHPNLLRGSLPVAPQRTWLLSGSRLRHWRWGVVIGIIYEPHYSLPTSCVCRSNVRVHDKSTSGSRCGSKFGWSITIFGKYRSTSDVKFT